LRNAAGSAARTAAGFKLNSPCGVFTWITVAAPAFRSAITPGATM
jgi:hypothetical protein